MSYSDQIEERYASLSRFVIKKLETGYSINGTGNHSAAETLHRAEQYMDRTDGEGVVIGPTHSLGRIPTAVKYSRPTYGVMNLRGKVVGDSYGYKDLFTRYTKQLLGWR